MTDYLICDLRPDWKSDQYITFWRANCANYAYPLSWAGNYQADEARLHTKKNTRGTLERFLVPREAAEAIAVAPEPGRIDGNAGPVIPNTSQNRAKLRSAAHHP